MTVTGASNPTCLPRFCALAGRPHLHCACGLPMAAGDATCALCALEGLAPLGRSAMSWDGSSYPSRRRHRIACLSEDSYGLLLRVVLNEDEAHPPHIGKALGRRRRRYVREPLTQERSASALELARDLAGGDGERAMARRVPHPVAADRARLAKERFR